MSTVRQEVRFVLNILEIVANIGGTPLIQKILYAAFIWTLETR